MASPKARKGAVAGVLAGLAAVAAAVAFTAAAPAPAPAEPASPAVAEVASEVRGVLAGPGETVHEYSGGEVSEAGPALSARHDGGSPATSSGSASSGIGGSSPEASLIPEAAQESLQAVESANNGGARERHWVVDYKTVWVPSIETVVDAPEREEPVYESHDVLVCNACGYSTESGNEMGSHLSQHAVQGVDEGYCSVVEQVQVGTRTVPAVCHEVDNGHYEVRESGGHWE